MIETTVVERRHDRRVCEVGRSGNFAENPSSQSTFGSLLTVNILSTRRPQNRMKALNHQAKASQKNEITNQLTPVTPKRRCGTLTDASSASTTVVCDAQQRRQWLACPFLDVVHPWFTRSFSATTIIYCSLCMIFGSVSRQQTWLNHDSLRRISRLPTRISTCCYLYSFCSLCKIRNAPVVFVFKGLDSPLHMCHQRTALTTIEQVICRAWSL